MRAIAIQKPGGPDTLVIVERPTPQPMRGEVLVRVRATAVNRADLLQRMGHYPAPTDAPADIPGLEIAGVVEAIGPNVERLKIGDRVFGLVGGGGYAEYCVSHERALAKIPDLLSDDDAAAVPEAFITAYDAMMQIDVHAGDAMLVSACGSGVGTAAIQLGHAIGATTLGTARHADKLERCKALGLDRGAVAKDGTWQLPAPTKIIELVGGPYLAEDLRQIEPRGKIVLVGLLAGAKADLDQALILRKRLTVVGTVMRARPLEEKIAAMRQFETHVVPLLAQKKVKPIVDKTFELADAPRAHEYMASNDGFGKIVLRC
ncbi:MAG: NAD(P)H-quinone oxidoreductase [Kofleriaceae bacterium]